MVLRFRANTPPVRAARRVALPTPRLEMRRRAAGERARAATARMSAVERAASESTPSGRPARSGEHVHRTARTPAPQRGGARAPRRAGGGRCRASRRGDVTREKKASSPGARGVVVLWLLRLLPAARRGARPRRTSRDDDRARARAARVGLAETPRRAGRERAPSRAGQTRRRTGGRGQRRI